jgi:hypothetical protein
MVILRVRILNQYSGSEFRVRIQGWDSGLGFRVRIQGQELGSGSGVAGFRVRIHGQGSWSKLGSVFRVHLRVCFLVKGIKY